MPKRMVAHRALPEHPQSGGVAEQGLTRRRLGRRGLTLAAGGGLAPQVAACGAGQTGEAPPVARPVEPVTVEYWTSWAQERIDVMLPHLPAFEERTRSMRANITGVSGYQAKLRTAIVAETPPDAALADIYSYALYADQRALLDVGPFVKRDRISFARDYLSAWGDAWCGRTYTFPMAGWSFAIAYNKTMFQQRGVPDPWDVQKGQWTWDDFAAALTRLTRDDVTGFQIDGHNLNRGYQLFIAANGGEYFDHEQRRYALDHPKTIEAMEWLYELTRRRLMLTPNEQAALDRETGGNPFAAGRLGTIGDPSYQPRPAAMKAIGERFEWDVAPYPRRRKGDPSYGLVQSNGNWVFARARHPEAGYELVKFLGGEEIQGALGRARIVQPALKKSRQDPHGFLKAPPKHMHLFNDIWESGYYRDQPTFTYRDLDVQPIINGFVHAAFHGERTMKEALLEANRAGNAQAEAGERCFKPPWKKR